MPFRQLNVKTECAWVSYCETERVVEELSIPTQRTNKTFFSCIANAISQLRTSKVGS